MTDSGTTWKGTALRALKNAGYRYNFDRDIYYNRIEKKAFSLEFIEDHGDVLEQYLHQQTSGNGWHFYFNSDPPPSVKQELERLLD